MKNLKSHIKKNEYKNCYLLYGNENYIKKIYLDKIIEKNVDEAFKNMNLDIFEEKIDIQNIFAILETLPFMSAKRIIVLKNIDIFNKRNKEFNDKLALRIKDISDTSILLILEDDVDKRTKLYKAINKYGYCANFDYLNERDLMSFIVKEFKKYGKNISNKEALHIIRIKGQDIRNIVNEIEKLASYKKEGNITISDIDEICTASLEIKVFALLKAMGNKQMNQALQMYSELLFNNEHPLKILVMITRQIRIILQVKVLYKNAYSVDSISKRIKLQRFIVNDSIKQAHNYDVNSLIGALEECLNTEIDIKTGNIEAKLGVELLIINLSKKS